MELDNALGVIKFQFDNAYGVYLLDTNAKRQAVELGQYLLDFVQGKIKPSDLKKLIANHIRTDIDIKKPLTIFVRYFTADGEGIYADVCSKDSPLLKAYMALFEKQHDGYYENLILDSPLTLYECNGVRAVRFAFECRPILQ